MKKFIPIIAVVLILAGVGYFVLNDSSSSIVEKKSDNIVKLEEFNKVKSCARIPNFLYKKGIKRPLID